MDLVVSKNEYAKTETLVGREMLILYGSESGNSEDAAGDIERMARRLHFQTRLEEMNDVGLSELLQYPLVVFVMSTTGQGDLPKNARQFWKSLLRKRLPLNCLSRVNFTSFGLGDSSYFQFNWAVRKLHKRLHQLGAREFLPCGEADERHEEGIDGTFLPWCLTLKTYLEEKHPLPPGISPIPPDVQLTPKFTIQLAEPGLATASRDEARPNRGTAELDKSNVLKDDSAQHSLEKALGSADRSPPASLLPIPGSWTAMVDKNRRVTPESHWQDVRSVYLRIKARVNGLGVPETLNYVPGDVAVLYPKNFEQDVQFLIDLMDWGDVADKPFVHHCSIRETPNRTPKNCHPLPNSTLRELLIHNYDITSIPRRHFFTLVAQFTEDPAHKERLGEFANPGHSDEFWDYTTRPRRSILEVLQDFRTVRIPYQHVPSVFPVIRGREYSIASGGADVNDPKTGDTLVKLLIALVNYKTVLRKTRQGLCSRYIASLPENRHIQISLRKNQIPPQMNNSSIPLLAIATGTGVAPVRSIIQSRHTMLTASTLLFYGGRNRQADFYFEDEWERMGVEVTTAFSRDQSQKIYVQDRIRENQAKVCALLRQGAAVCVCGSSGKMPEAVRLALYDCMVKGDLATDQEEAKQKLHKNFVFFEEVW